MFQTIQDTILAFLADGAYRPLEVYACILGAMFICSLGVPIPEELIIISAGLVGHMALNPDLYPPPEGAGHPVNPYTLAVVCFSAVVITDYLVFSMGKFFGKQIIYSKRFGKYFPEEKILRIREWAKKYGLYAPGVFRFLPGLRFPGHMMCGAMGVPTWAFLLTDGGAALFSVPTQVLLVSFYGNDILLLLSKFKKWVLIVILILVAIYLVRRFILGKKSLPAL